MEIQLIQNKIYEIRGVRVMLDFDLAVLYEVKTGVLNQAVKRNGKRFPPDFMFQLSKEEFGNLKSQFVTSSWGGTRKLPYAFTEQGVAMLSGLLNSDKAIAVNIAIMRAFVALRQYALHYEELRRQLEEFIEETEGKFDDVYIALSKLSMHRPAVQAPRRRIGFKAADEATEET